MNPRLLIEIADPEYRNKQRPRRRSALAASTDASPYRGWCLILFQDMPREDAYCDLLCLISVRSLITCSVSRTNTLSYD